MSEAELLRRIAVLEAQVRELRAELQQHRLKHPVAKHGNSHSASDPLVTVVLQGRAANPTRGPAFELWYDTTNDMLAINDAGTQKKTAALT